MYDEDENIQHPWKIEVETKLPVREVKALGEKGKLIASQLAESDQTKFRIFIQNASIERVTLHAESHRPRNVVRPRIEVEDGQVSSCIKLEAIPLVSTFQEALAARLKIDAKSVRTFYRRVKWFLCKHWLTISIAVVAVLATTLIHFFWPEITGRVPRVVRRDITLRDKRVFFGKETIVLPKVRLKIESPTAIELPTDALVIVLGEFFAEGVSSNPACFEPASGVEGKWQGIHAIGNDAKLEMKHAVITKAHGTDPQSWPPDFTDRVTATYSVGIKIRRGGGCSATRSRLRLEKVMFTRCSSLKGGAVFLNDTPPMHETSATSRQSRSSRNLIMNCMFEANTARGYEVSGGASVFLYLAAASIQDCNFVDNTCDAPSGCGAGIYFGAHSIGEVDRCVFKDNHVGGDGAAIYIRGTYGPDSFRAEVAPEEAVFIRIRSCEFVGNIAKQRGGAISASKLTIPKIVDCKFISNEAEIGGAIDYSPSSLDEDFFDEVHGSFAIRRCKFERNHAHRCGCAIVTIRRKGVWASPTESEFVRAPYSVVGRIHFADPKGDLGTLTQHDKTSIVAENEGLACHEITSNRHTLTVGFQEQPNKQLCQATALAMLLNYRQSVTQWSAEQVRAGLAVIGGPTKHVTWDRFLSEKLPKYKWSHVYTDDKNQAGKLIRAMINHGLPVVMNVGFTVDGHVILIIGYKLAGSSLELICHDPNGEFDFGSGTFSKEQALGQSVIYAIDSCRVCLEYRESDNGSCEYRKITNSGSTSHWLPTNNKTSPGIYSDWELIVAEEIAKKVGG